MSDVSAQEISVAGIDFGDRLRPVDAAMAAMIGESIAEKGLIHPIIVRQKGQRYELVVGAHRLTGAQLQDMATIRAEVRELTDDEARLLEVDENLDRKNLSELDKALFVAERKRVWEAMYPETRNGKKKGKSNQHVRKIADSAIFHDGPKINRYSLEAARKMDESERTIQVRAAIGLELQRDLLPLIRQTYLTGHQGDLAKLVRMPPEAQRAVLEALIAGEIARVGEFQREGSNDNRAGGTDWEKVILKWRSLWGTGMPMHYRRQFLLELGVNPKEVERVIHLRTAKAA